MIVIYIAFVIIELQSGGRYKSDGNLKERGVASQHRNWPSIFFLFNSNNLISVKYPEEYSVN